jgi:hypothetical protein
MPENARSFLIIIIYKIDWLIRYYIYKMSYEIVLSVKNMTLVGFWSLTDYDRGRIY